MIPPLVAPLTRCSTSAYRRTRDYSISYLEHVSQDGRTRLVTVELVHRDGPADLHAWLEVDGRLVPA